MSSDEQRAQQQAQSKKTLIYGLSLAIGMFGFGYVLVPIYNVMCKQLGINGKVDLVAAQKGNGNVDMNRTIKVLFLSTNNQQIAWDFHPEQTMISLHPGENKRVAYFAKNEAGHRMTVQAIPSVSPGRAAKYLRKTECFCFTQQTFDDKEQHSMPIVFRLDKEIPKDITNVTISYTLFDATKFAPVKAPVNAHLTG